MKLKTLEIKNFRCFESLSIDLDKQLTVLVAKNGQGKSSVLDAIRIGLWAFVSGFDLARNSDTDSENDISIDDVRVLKMRDGQMARQLPCSITVQVNYDVDWFTDKSKVHTWSRYRDNEVGGIIKTKDDANALLIKDFASFLQSQVRNIESPDFDLPVIAYYGTGRLWNQKAIKIKDNPDLYNPDPSFFMQLFAYRDCLDSASSYKDFEKWFTWLFEIYREEQIKRVEKNLSPEMGSVWKNAIRIVQQAINEILPAEMGWCDLEYSVSNEKSLVLNHPNGKLKVKQLSDGIRNTLAMVGDIAYRCIKLNFHYLLSSLEIDAVINLVKKTHGIVMIDEIEMHLHPAWQQSILGNLIKAFPNIQFIVTTHSPQVISTVPSQQIRILDDGKIYPAEAGTQGAESSRILKRIFEVDPRPQHDPNTQLLNEYLDLVYADKWDEAKEKRAKLDAIYQGNEPALTEADLYIENRQWELEVEENQ